MLRHAQHERIFPNNSATFPFVLSLSKDDRKLVSKLLLLRQMKIFHCVADSHFPQLFFRHSGEIFRDNFS
jgi:hypothetical protein